MAVCETFFYDLQKRQKYCKNIIMKPWKTGIKSNEKLCTFDKTEKINNLFLQNEALRQCVSWKFRKNMQE